MPDDNLTDAQREAYAVASVDEVSLETVEISHDTAGTVYLVKDQQELTATLEDASTVTFEPVGFTLSDPIMGEDGAQEMTLTVDNVDKRISEYLDNVDGSQIPTFLKKRYFLASDTSQPSTVEPYELTVTEVTSTLTQVTLTATFVDVLNKAYPNNKYTRKQFPSLGD